MFVATHLSEQNSMGDGLLLDQIKALVENYYPDDGQPGCAVMVVSGDETHTLVRGIANLETGTAITARTNFRLASVAKQFTAACILQLRQAGRLHLEQPITDFFPEFASYGYGVHLQHLLRHTSGLKEYEKLLPVDLKEPVSDADVLKLLAAQTECVFEPGSQFRYSNSGYALLAMVVEAVSGLSFPDYLRQNVFEPLGMSNTLAFVDRPGAPEVANRAIGYVLNDAGEFVWADQNLTTAVLGDGGIYCSAEDYARWIRGYWSGRVIDDNAVAEAWSPGETSGGDIVPYGFGWRLEMKDGRWRPYHPGSTSGFRNGVVVDGEQKWAVLVLSNRCNGDAVALAGGIGKLLTQSRKKI